MSQWHQEISLSGSFQKQFSALKQTYVQQWQLEKKLIPSWLLESIEFKPHPLVRKRDCLKHLFQMLVSINMLGCCQL